VARRSALRKAEASPAATGERGDAPPEGAAGVSGDDMARATRRSAVTLDRLIHERVRLGIVSALAVHDALSFNDLKATLGITDGNLSVHARKLEEAGYIHCSKSFEGRVPRTEYRLTDAGRAALTRYVDHMEALIQALREG